MERSSAWRELGVSIFMFPDTANVMNAPNRQYHMYPPGASRFMS